MTDDDKTQLVDRSPEAAQVSQAPRDIPPEIEPESAPASVSESAAQRSRESAAPTAAKSVRPTKDRRAFTRRPAKGTAVCRPGRLGSGKGIRGKLVDLSSDGAAVMIDKPLELGQPVELELIALAGARSIRLNAFVRRVVQSSESQWRVGCQFESRVTHDRLAHFIRF